MGAFLGLQGGHCSLWDWGGDVRVPYALKLRLWVLTQANDLERGQGGELGLSLPPIDAKIMGLGEGQLQTPPMAKSNYKL